MNQKVHRIDATLRSLESEFFHTDDPMMSLLICKSAVRDLWFIGRRKHITVCISKEEPKHGQAISLRYSYYVVRFDRQKEDVPDGLWPEYCVTGIFPRLDEEIRRFGILRGETFYLWIEV